MPFFESCEDEVYEKNIVYDPWGEMQADFGFEFDMQSALLRYFLLVMDSQRVLARIEALQSLQDVFTTWPPSTDLGAPTVFVIISHSPDTPLQPAIHEQVEADENSNSLFAPLLSDNEGNVDSLADLQPNEQRD